MDILYKSEHLSCVCYDQSKKPIIEVVRAEKNSRKNLPVSYNEIVFIMEGRVRYSFKELVTHEAVKGQIIFRPAGADYSYEALIDSVVVIFRIHKPIILCDSFAIEKLYGIKAIDPAIEQETELFPEQKKLGTLEMNSRIWYFLDGIVDCISDGLKCRSWFELKINEFLILLRVYYNKEVLCDFFMLILSEDTVFSEYILRNWRNYNSIGTLATSLNMTRKQFTSRFVKIFGVKPSHWILEARAQRAYRDIASTRKPFKQIAHDNGFSDDTQFYRFCKKRFGKTATQIREESKRTERLSVER